MAITEFKNSNEIGKSTNIFVGQEFESTELALIQKESVPIKFNVGVNDVLEFLLYDSNNNLLIQEGYGKVRYIRGENINQYLVQSGNIDDEKLQGGGYIINAKKLITEAGYKTGYFRIQLNFINNRVGSEYQKDRLFIEEISATRQHIRVLPFNNFRNEDLLDQDIKTDLNQSYDAFLLGKFSGDEVYREIADILDSIKATDVANIMKTVLTQSTIDILTKELNIVGGYDLFYSRVIQTMKVAVVNELLYRNSSIGNPDFGKQLGDTLRNSFSKKDFNYYTKDEIIKLIFDKLKESIRFYLPKRQFNLKNEVNNISIDSFDTTQKTTVRLQSDNSYKLPTINTSIQNT